MKILDLGCGRGELLVHLAQQGALIWGMDYAEEALNLTQELLEQPDYAQLQPQIHLLRGQCARLALSGKSV